MLKRITGALLVIALVTAGGAAAAWKLSPSFREKLLLAALLSEIPELQRAAATALRDDPSAQATATSSSSPSFWRAGIACPRRPIPRRCGKCLETTAKPSLPA